MKEPKFMGGVVEDTFYTNVYSFDHLVERMPPENNGKLAKSIEVRNFKFRLYVNHEESYKLWKLKLINRPVIPLKENSVTVFSKKKDYVKINSYLKAGVQ